MAISGMLINADITVGSAELIGEDLQLKVHRPKASYKREGRALVWLKVSFGDELSGINNRGRK